MNGEGRGLKSEKGLRVQEKNGASTKDLKSEIGNEGSRSPRGFFRNGGKFAQRP